MYFRQSTYSNAANTFSLTGIPGNPSPGGGPQSPDTYQLDLPTTSITLTFDDIQCLFYCLEAALNVYGVHQV